MSKYPTLLQQFRSFCFQNHATNLEVAIEYFAVFGGMGWNVDMSKPLDVLIEEKILINYRYIHGDITTITQSKPIHHKLLTALATGDRREHSAFKKARVGRIDGEDSIDFLIDHGLLTLDKSIEQPMDANEEVSNKLLFTQPFMRFWFASISPYYKSIKEGDYTEVKEHWKHIQQNFSDLIYAELVREVMKKSLMDDPIITIGSYWDKHVEIEILAKTKSGKMIAGACKYSNSKANKSELTKLKERCSSAELTIDAYILFSKNKFSHELKKEKGKTLKLFSLNMLGSLLFELNEKDLLVHKNKRY